MMEKEGFIIITLGRSIKREEGDGPKNKGEDDSGFSMSHGDVEICF
jgi:hypothetical protein